VLQIFRHANLTHQTVLVAVHGRQLAHVRETVLQTVGELVCVNVTESELHV
jgi:hypothetical protein